MASGDVNNDKEIEEVCEETKQIFECFVETQLERDRQRNTIGPDTPGLPREELPHAPENKDSVSWQIGKKLASIADKLALDESSKGLIKEIVTLVNVGPDDSGAFKEFSEIAKKVIEGGISWKNVATLFYFGYRIARDRLTKGVQHFLSQLLQWIIDIFKGLGIFKWIISNGGWRDFLGNDSDDGNVYSALVYPSVVVGVVALICYSIYRYYR